MNTTMASQIAKLQKMGVKELQAEYEKVFNKKTKSRNAPWLFKVIARKLQDDEEPESANKPVALPSLVAKYDRKGKKNSRSKRVSGGKKADAKQSKRTKTQHREPGERDKRLPAVGSTITRVYKGTKYLVRVLDDGFEYDGKQYKSLSRVAMEITGAKSINGFLFWQLGQYAKKAGK